MADSVLVGVNDLFFSSKVQAAARELGVPLKCLPTCEGVLAAGREAEPSMVILDLDSIGGDPLGLIRSLKADDGMKKTRVVGFCRHTNGAMIAAAGEAGIDRVMPRSEFFPALPEMLRASAERAESAQGGSE